MQDGSVHRPMLGNVTPPTVLECHPGESPIRSPLLNAQLRGDAVASVLSAQLLDVVTVPEAAAMVLTVSRAQQKLAVPPDATCRGTADVVPAVCDGTADEIPEACSGGTDATGMPCSINVGRVDCEQDGLSTGRPDVRMDQSQLADTCVYTAPYTPICDLDNVTDAMDNVTRTGPVCADDGVCGSSFTSGDVASCTDQPDCSYIPEVLEDCTAPTCTFTAGPELPSGLTMASEAVMACHSLSREPPGAVKSFCAFSGSAARLEISSPSLFFLI